MSSRAFSERFCAGRSTVRQNPVGRLELRPHGAHHCHVAEDRILFGDSPKRRQTAEATISQFNGALEALTSPTRPPSPSNRSPATCLSGSSRCTGSSRGPFVASRGFIRCRWRPQRQQISQR
jgi:hypothetical protein